ncbi:hypothetical protein AB4039_32605 [Streptomyces sp. M-16]|uniref:hypothetical protein n=1 Tax=Streptomyces sp. M-16 TaxID=3233040 RepID=UPI003F961C5D
MSKSGPDVRNPGKDEDRSDGRRDQRPRSLRPDLLPVPGTGPPDSPDHSQRSHDVQRFPKSSPVSNRLQILALILGQQGTETAGSVALRDEDQKPGPLSCTVGSLGIQSKLRPAQRGHDQSGVPIDVPATR